MLGGIADFERLGDLRLVGDVQRTLLFPVCAVGNKFEQRQYYSLRLEGSGVGGSCMLAPSPSSSEKMRRGYLVFVAADFRKPEL